MHKEQDNEIGPWLALFHLGLPLPLSLRLLEYFGGPRQLLAADVDQLKALGVKDQAVTAIRAYQRNPQAGELYDLIHASLAWTEHPGRYLITQADVRYPALLKEIATPPLLLFVEGDPELLAMPQIALVGSRNASVSGIDTARLFAREFAQYGLTVTSGLALGVDGAGHLGALEAGRPTVAVMATGADIIYPRRHAQLADRIREQGVLVTEFPLGTAPLPAYFPQRNRVISGLSLGVLVVEAALKSGSLITTRYAVEQGREVFAIPGSIHNPTTKGCHALIRQGAKLVESVDDILEELAPQIEIDRAPKIQNGKEAGETSLDQTQQNILALVGHEPTSIDTLVERSQIPVAELNRILICLELESRIKNVPGGYVRTIL